ncbi:hypothetical protein [Dyella sp. RRB7]|uniref:hypothetical protein n=1 Tax=Dyella sp. RRB7 TaxID=2919502 RepID=UPI001FAAE05A|nr:hypothetical protein [Dyella sp. RRB7]
MNARSNTAIADEFFTLNGRYLIDPSSAAKDLAIDASCLLDGVIHTVHAIIDGLSDKGSDMTANVQRQVPAMLYGLVYQLEMAQRITGSLERATFADQSSGPSSLEVHHE